jgi:hypothetical protein
MRLSRLLCACSLLWVLAASGAAAAELPPYAAADPDAPVVTEASLLAADRFWPYHVSLIAPWQPGGATRPLPAGARGVLIRVEPDGRARIDFGRDGLYGVPLAATDAVELANRVRRGEADKTLPNFVMALGPRLVDAAGDSMRPLPLEVTAAQRGFLTVFADPRAEAFAELAAALAPLRDRGGVMTVVLPQARLPDAQVRERLRALGWPVPFVFDHLAEIYARTLLDEAASLPWVALQTREGRLLFASPWNQDVTQRLADALEAAFPDNSMEPSRQVHEAPAGTP